MVLVLEGFDWLGHWSGVHLRDHMLGQTAAVSVGTSGLSVGGWVEERECPSAEEAHPLLLGVPDGTATLGYSSVMQQPLSAKGAGNAPAARLPRHVYTGATQSH